MRERTVHKVTANISANNAILQFVLILILFSQVTYAWNWRCWGAVFYRITYEKRFPDEINKMDCHSINWFSDPPLVYQRNNTYLDIEFCGSWFVTAPWNCKVTVNIQGCPGGSEQKEFKGFNRDDDCAKDKEHHCHWQMHEEYLSLYNPKKNIFESRNYDVNTCL